ncbi:DUF624 domain-containing protein [Gracilibacillus caseinilyticus]|uniref:DUF624 domain-containing protein n=1 Tax=Gracilibacillus caseinilyticus TaxID=2932256 RepID=A0ABY4ES74_9BACI|nr:DUF624 domain-containing protein [Gracilibacillus caseinilyticus]UOQ46577.1 DUF624 domain-containing protein [Gracilibacillus caseinilyticus]
MQQGLGKLFGVTDWIARLAVANVLWLLFNLPIVILLLNMMVNGVNLAVSVVVMVLTPFIFFPATTALFACVRDWTLDRDQHSIVRSFCRYYTGNYRKSCISGILLTAVWTIWGIDYYYLSSRNVVLLFAFLMFGLILFVYTIHFFSMLAHFEMDLRMLWKNAFLLTFGRPLLTVVISLISFVILYVSMNGLLFLIPFFTGSLIAFLTFSAFYRWYLNFI